MSKSSSILVSIVMPCLNACETIGESIQSVLSQSHSNLELIVIDDGSIDSTPEVIEFFSKKDSRVKFVKNKGVHGVSYARNIGIELAQGEYICFLDSDDTLLVNSIKERLDFAELNSVDIVYGAYYRLNPNGEKSIVIPPKCIHYEDMLKRNYIGNLTGFYNARTVRKRIQKNVKHEDYLMWLEMLRDVGCAYSVGEIALGVYRVSAKSLSGNKFRSFIWHWLILRKELRLPIIRASFYQIFYFISSILNRLKVRFRNSVGVKDI